MSDVSNSDLMNVLLTVKQDIGGIKADLVSQATQFRSHVEDDRRLEAKVDAMQLTAVSVAGVAKGRAGVWGMVGAAVATAATLLVDWLRH